MVGIEPLLSTADGRDVHVRIASAVFRRSPLVQSFVSSPIGWRSHFFFTFVFFLGCCSGYRGFFYWFASPVFIWVVPMGWIDIFIIWFERAWINELHHVNYLFLLLSVRWEQIEKFRCFLNGGRLAELETRRVSISATMWPKQKQKPRRVATVVAGEREREREREREPLKYGESAFRISSTAGPRKATTPATIKQYPTPDGIYVPRRLVLSSH